MQKPGFRLTVAGAVLLTLVGTPVAALAVDRIPGQISHFIECFGYLLTDEASHIELCSPNPNPNWTGSPTTGSGGGGGDDYISSVPV